MATQTFTLDDFRRYLRDLPDHLHKAALKGLRAGGQRAIPVLQRSADTAPPASPRGKVGARSSGQYRGAFRCSPIADGVVLHNLKSYGDVIERGRHKGRKPPPTKVIERWAQLRLGLSPKEAKRAAFPIARAIGRRGLQGRNVMSRARPEVVRVMAEEVKAAVAQELRVSRMRRGR